MMNHFLFTIIWQNLCFKIKLKPFIWFYIFDDNILINESNKLHSHIFFNLKWLFRFNFIHLVFLIV